MYAFTKQLSTFVFSLALIVNYVHTQGHYTIAAPGTLRPNSKYTTHVSVSEVPSGAKIRITLKGPQQYIKFTELDVPSNSARSVTFELENIPKGTYTLEAKGLAGILFENATNLEFVDNLPRAYLQTDKAMYKHGETIQFRVIFLDQYLLPAKVTQPLSVLIKDSENNRIQRFSDIVLNTGVFKGKLKLAESVVSGIWSMEVFQGDVKLADKIFEVKEYELPLFEVELDASSHVSFNQEAFLVTVRAHYTFGKPISGNCLLKIFAKGKHAPIEREFPLIDGKKETSLQLSEFGQKIQRIQINVTVQDTVTLTQRTVMKTVSISAKRYLIDTPPMTHECDGPNDTFTYRARITHLNGSSIDVDEEIYVKLDVGVNKEPSKIVSYVDENGDVEAEIACSNYTNVNITIEYGGETSLGEIKLQQRGSNSKGGVYVRTQSPTVGNPMEIRFVADELYSSFVCVIVGRGNIVYNNVIQVPSGGSSRKHTFFITPTHEMMPKAHIFAYFFKNGKMFYYETTFSVEKQFQNSITIDTQETVKPGSIISITVDTDPNSYVGLLGMDKSVLLFRSGNDFDAEKILNWLESVATKTPEAYLPPNSSYPGEIAGLVTMTNAQYDAELTQTAMDIRARAAARKQRVRRNFFETFAFDDFVSVDGEDTVMEKVPDTITSWVITGFSINAKTGFTLTSNPTVLRTFLEFFVAVNLPYAVKIGEIITLPVVVFNYLHTDTRASVSMEIENNEFEFVAKLSETKYTISTYIRRGKTKTVYFEIRPKITGMITLRISAKCPFASDVIIKKLRVEYEGTTVWKNMDFYINGEESKTIKLGIPRNSVPHSEHIEISVMSFLMGSMLNLINSGENFDQLIRSPTGCAEQNMIYSVPNLLVLKYLQSTSITNKTLFERAKSYLEIGYQRELTYKLTDGSYSTWGRVPGITWLTAYVTRIFHEAKLYCFVDDNVLKRGYDFLASKQEADGSFREDGRLLDFANLNKLSVTASVLLAFLENHQHSTEEYKNIVEKGLEYVRNNVKQSSDMRSIALSLYVLQLCKDPMVTELLTILEGKAKTNGNYKWWQYAEKPQNIDVYVTGYILLTMMELKKPVTPIIKWLVLRRNSNGGFASTFETEVGLRALATYAAKYKEQQNILKIDVYAQGRLLQTFEVGENSTDLNKKIVLPKHIRELQFNSIGKGKATFQINYRYNSLTPEKTIFELNSSISSPSAIRKTLEICTHLHSVHVESTGMAVMEVNLPSSEQVAPNCCNLTHTKRAKMIKRSKSNQKLDIYFEGFSKDSSDCLYIPMMKVFNVTNQKAGSIVIYDYYKKDSMDKYFYKM